MNPSTDNLTHSNRISLGRSASTHGEVEAKHRMLLVQWLNSLLPTLNLPIDITDDELRACLGNGTVLCQILNRLRPGSVNVASDSDHSLPSQSENAKRFLSALDGMGLPKFEIQDLEKGHMKAVVDCLLTLRAKSLQNAWGDSISRTNSNVMSSRGIASSNNHFSPPSGGDQRQVSSDSKCHRVKRGQVMADPSAALLNQVGNKFHEVFQLKHGSYADIPAAKISELMKSSSLDNAPTQSLLSVVNGILEESVERRNGEIPHRVACLLRKVVQEIERRISTQAEHLRTQNNLFKAREEKYQSRIKVLEALASGTREETESGVTSQLQQLKTEKTKEEKKADDKDVIRLMKEQEEKNMEILTLKHELDTLRKTYEAQFSQLGAEAKVAKGELKQKSQEYQHLLEKFINKDEKQDEKNLEIFTLKKELETTKKSYEVQCSQLEAEAKNAKGELKQKSQEYEHLLEKFRNKDEKTDEKNVEISTLKNELETMQKELETMKPTYELQCSQLEAEAKDAKGELKQKSLEYEHLLEKFKNESKERDDKNMDISTLKQELETMKKTYEVQCSQLEAEAKDAKRTYEVQCSKLEAEAKDAKGELKKKSQEYEDLQEELRNKLKGQEASAESKFQKWKMKERQMQNVVDFQFSSVQNLKLSWESIKQEALKEQRIYAEECNRLGVNLKPLVDAAENYQAVLAENRKLFNEVQELKGNIRVYCRIRPLLSVQKEKQSIVEHIGENDLVVANPSKQGKDALRSFKFNKVFGPASTQAEVYSDIQAFIRSVLDGYNVCIFAYGQTGSGKTYTMSGPNNATNETIGVNYRALNDLFSISTSRSSSIVYDIGVQIIEIYNEQVRDLLTTDASKKLGILNHSQPNGLVVPDASMFPVKSTSDVMRLMDIGFKNRAKGSTAMNERSSRSHSVVSIHVRGVDKKSGSTLQGNLHLVDLAGSERVDRSDVAGDRLKEAQHINKSLSALGDVIFALSQKSAHVPYRNSKLTQLLQTALGGQAKTLMLVQINSDIKSFSESLSTLKFAERVSGVELGAARSSKEGRDVRDLMEQVASLKDTILTKDEEIERLQLLKDLKNVYPGGNPEKREASP